MTAVGQTRSFTDVRERSALPPIATDELPSREVRVVPIGDIHCLRGKIQLIGGISFNRASQPACSRCRVGGFICELVARSQMRTDDLHHSVG
jgi:hypothetical protein